MSSTLRPEYGRPFFDAWGCEVVGGTLRIPLSVPDRATLTMEGAVYADGVLAINMVSMKLFPRSWFGQLVPLQDQRREMELRYTDGRTIRDVVIPKTSVKLLSNWIEGLPASWAAMEIPPPETRNLAVIRFSDHWTAVGWGQAPENLAWIVRIIGQSPERQVGYCTRVEEGVRRHRALLEFDQTFAMYSLDGEELAREQFTARGCEGRDPRRSPGTSPVQVEEGEVKRWVKSLLPPEPLIHGFGMPYAWR